MELMNKNLTSKHRKIFAVIAAAFLIFALSGCNRKNGGNKKPVVLCSTFPLYDWARNILNGSDFFDLQLLNTKGTDMHSFQPSVSDMARISSADFLFYVGGESEEWIKDALSERKNQNQISLSFIDCLGQELMFESSEGILGEVEEEEEIPAYDEHIWLSLKKADKCAAFMAITFSASDEENAELYAKNYSAYNGELLKLDDEFKSVFGNESVLLFADRFPFLYFADDYNLTTYAAFPGCSAETEASFRTVIGLADKVKENNLQTIFVLENSSSKMADQIIKTAGTETKIKVLNSLQGISMNDIKNGATYIGLMEENLEVLRGSY
ncbi:MAG: metal ABC transporter substrate-binding protein [Treponema sp.]|nr:metal ABC transporter substrate-binding protein [Treponema sp.]